MKAAAFVYQEVIMKLEYFIAARKVSSSFNE